MKKLRESGSGCEMKWVMERGQVCKGVQDMELTGSGAKVEVPAVQRGANCQIIGVGIELTIGDRNLNAFKLLVGSQKFDHKHKIKNLSRN